MAKIRSKRSEAYEAFTDITTHFVETVRQSQAKPYDQAVALYVLLEEAGIQVTMKPKAREVKTNANSIRPRCVRCGEDLCPERFASTGSVRCEICDEKWMRANERR